MMTRSYCYFFGWISLLLHTFASPTLNLCRHDQRDALLEFKYEFPILQYNLSLSSWNKSIDCCSWEGVICDAKFGKVISLSLTNIYFNSSLDTRSSLFKLQHLRSLTLSNCYLYGRIPSSLGNLTHLKMLELSSNSLVGQIPASVGNLTQLKYLILAQNKLSGNIPLSFANLNKLSVFDISINHFTGESFPLILPNITHFYQFKSTPPPSTSGLKYFDVRENSFYGSFPTSLFMISSLVWVDLSGNQFKGPIEFENISSPSRLQYMHLARNQFDGPIPKSISQYLNFEVLDISYNGLTGPIPISLSKLVKLDHLDLSNNKLEGEVPSWLGVLQEVMLSHNSFLNFGKSWKALDETQIKVLDLNSNSFRGSFPKWICKLRLLSFLDLSNNSFSGSIPQCLRNSTVSLVELNLRNNNFNGIIPNIFEDATELLSLDISHNQLEGTLPKSLINCKAMQLLNVGHNKIKDKFPSWLGYLPSLKVFILRSNLFYGLLYHHQLSIGFQSLKVIDVSHNHLNGTLPTFYFSNWREMNTLYENYDDTYMEYYMYYAAVYHDSMELVKKGVNTEFERIRKDFRAIDFSENRFSGNIPKSIGLLKELHLLNLSGNTFTENIPQSLENLTKLEALDLSRNQLSGQIPQDLGSLSFLSIMNFSHNNLEGPLPRGTQFESQNCSSFMENPRLFGLEEICGESHVPSPMPQESGDFMEPEKQMISWIAAAIAYGPGVFCGLVIGHIFVSYKQKWFMGTFIKKWARVAP